VTLVVLRNLEGVWRLDRGLNLARYAKWKLESVQKLEGNQMGARSCKDFIWSEGFIGLSLYGVV